MARTPTRRARRLFRRTLAATALCVVALAPGAAAHELDHPMPSYAPDAPAGTGFNAGGSGAQWQLLTTFPTGNPHTDLDFFTQGGETFAAVGTLGIGPNGGGQTIVQLTQGGAIDPTYVAGHPSATCLSDPQAALSLQHDIEATPKGTTILNATNMLAVRKDAQLLIDATDAAGRCHDQGIAGLVNAPRGGLEIIDITNVRAPVEIGLTSHIGQAHTVNIDPKRPWIAYAVTSDTVSVGANRKRQNEVAGSGDRYDLDGFEVVDLSSCMNFPAGTTATQKRALCRPQVYRYRYPTTEMALGHTGQGAVYGCHELEVYANDLLTCGSGNAAMVFDMSAAFDSKGKPRGTPLPCNVRPSSSAALFASGALVTDCVIGTDGQNLDVPSWLAMGAPSLQGVRHVGSVHHMGRGSGGSATPTYGSHEDIDFDHELELSGSGRLLLATDERGGGVSPPGATCAPGVDNTAGNGGIHAYRVSALDTTLPASAAEAWDPYARTPEGGKAIYRAAVRTEPEASLCTAHVFQQIPGQNRIFMGWYSQGTQVVDFTEYKDGTVRFREAGWFLPEHTNQWVSHIFRMKQNGDGSWTYWGATGDFSLGIEGRSAIDVYKVTLPAPPVPGANKTVPPPKGYDDECDEDDSAELMGPLAVPAGGQLAYKVTYRNNGPRKDKGCKVKHKLDSEQRVVSTSGAAYDPVTHTVTWDVGEVPAGEARSLLVFTVVDQVVAQHSTIESRVWFDRFAPDVSPSATVVTEVR